LPVRGSSPAAPPSRATSSLCCPKRRREYPLRFHEVSASDPDRPITKQGAGLVDAAKVLYYTTTVVPPLIHLNDTDNFAASHSIEIHNDGPSDVVYTVWHEPGTMAITKPNPSAWVGAFPEDVVGEGTTAEVKLSASNFTVAAGKSYTLTADFTEPTAIDPVRLPVYGGQIVVSGNNGESVRVTYQGEPRQISVLLGLC
jgi:Fn3 domain-containing protein